MNTVSLKNIPGQQDFVLKEDNKTVLKLRYKDNLNIARVETEKERRVLRIEDEGLLRTKLILKNEYGVRIGSLIYDNFSHTLGSVDIENTRYRFFFRQNTFPELQIYKGSRRNVIYSCQLAPDPDQSKDAKPQSASFIIAVSWYLFSKETVKENYLFNEAVIL